MCNGSLRLRTRFAAAAVLAAGTTVSFAQIALSPAFTYRAELANAGSPATGVYDLRFRLYDAAENGGQVGPTLCMDDLEVADGRVTASLDFGWVFAGQERYLEVEVRADSGQDCSDASGYTLLTPRQVLSATPQATFAMGAASADTAATAGSATNALSLGGQPAANVALLNGNQTFSGVMNLTNAGNTIAGNGSGLTLLNASAISTGTLSAARMPTNWAAGGDLTGVFPTPFIAPGSVSLSKLSPDVQSVLSQLSASSVSLGEAVAWGGNGQGQANVPALPPGVGYSVVGMGYQHGLAMRSDGVCIGWGLNSSGEVTIPALPPGVTFTALGGGDGWSCGLRSDGQIVAWGYNGNGETNVPALPPGVTYTAVSAQVSYALALRSDGQVVAWGNNNSGQTNVAPLPPGLTYTAVGAGENHALAVLSNGTVVAWGSNSDGQADVPPGLSGVVAVRGGEYSSMALKSDGTIVPWGWNGQGALNVPAIPPGLTYTAVAGSHGSWLGLRSNGTVVAWGYNGAGQNNVPPGLVDVVAIATGFQTSLALRMPSFVPTLSTSGGVSVAGAGTFGSSVSASSFEGSGAALTNLSAAQVTGTFAAAQIPNLDASKITSGTLGNARTTGTTSNTPSSLVLRDASGNFAAGTVTAAAFVGDGSGLTNVGSGSTNASDLTSGTLADARLSSNVPLTNAANTFTDTGVTSFAGNLGIGTTTPNGKADIKGSLVIRNPSSSDDAIRLSPSAAGYGLNAELVIQDATAGDGTNGAPFHISRNAMWDTGPDTYSRMDTTDEATSVVFNNDGDLVFRSAAPGANPISWTESLRIDAATGNVGIGIVTPNARLDVRNLDNTSVQFIAGVANQGENTFIKNNSIGFSYGFNGVSAGWINQTGYLGGQTQFRGLNIGNGTGGQIAQFDGATSNVGIGIINPTARLEARTADTTSVQFIAGTTVNTSANTFIKNATMGFGYGFDGPAEGWINATSYQTGLTQFRDLKIGNGKGALIALFDGETNSVGIGTATPTPGFRLDVAGSIRCTSLTQTSSREYKQNIEPLTGALDSIMKLRGVTYAWNDRAPEQVRGAHDIGFIADEMNEILPEIVAKDKDGKPLGIDYGKVTPVAVEAIKQLKHENDDLKARIERLERLLSIKR